MAKAADAAESDTRVLVSPDGSLIAKVAGERIEIVSGATLAVEAEIGIDASASGHDVALAGDPLRLIVIARYEGSVGVHVIDPRGPTAVGELSIKSPMRLMGAAGDHVWLAGPSGSVIVDVVRKELAMWPLALRTPVAAAGPFTNGRFVVSTGGVIEEWDPETRQPVRRFRLGRQTAARHVGGGARQVWLVPVNEPDHVEVVPLVNHGQPTRIDLPEPVARCAADPTHETLIVVGATTRTVYAVDLSGRVPVMSLEGLTGFDAAWLGTTGAVVVAAVGLGLEVIPVVGRTRPGLSGDRDGPRPPMAPTMVAVPLADAAAALAGNVAERLSQWRERMRASAPREAPAASAWVGPSEQPATWRDHLAAWTRSMLSGTRGDAPVITEGPLVEVATRFGLDAELSQALWLLYGAHLCGHDGVAAVDLAGVVRRRWDEALGRGALAAMGLARWRDSRARLTRAVADAIDELPPRLGTIVVSEAAATDGVRAVVAADASDLDAIAQWAAPRLGPVFVANARGLARPERFLLEARARGATPVLTWPRADTILPPAALLVVGDEATARAVPAPVIGRWPASD